MYFVIDEWQFRLTFVCAIWVEQSGGPLGCTESAAKIQNAFGLHSKPEQPHAQKI